MNGVQKLKNSIDNRDSSALSRAMPSIKAKPDFTAVELFNELFKQLRAILPANLPNLKTQEDLNEFRRQWVMAFAENGITTIEQINTGISVARKQEKPFWPSTGQFIQWCNSNKFSSAGLPDEQQLVDRVLEFSVKKSGYSCNEEYPFRSNAEYWMVTRLYHKMRDHAWTEADLRKHAKGELESMLIRINAGEQIPEPKPQLDKKYNPLPKDLALSKIAEIRAKYRMGAA